MADYPKGNELKFNRFLVSEYLKYGSVDEVLRAHGFELPVSTANYHRVLDKWGIIKAAGPNSALTEILDFLYKMVSEEIPLDKIYEKMPSSFRISAVTLYRILGYIKEGITRRLGTALIIHPEGHTHKVLTAKELAVPRLHLNNKAGLWTIPMTFSKKTDMREDAILRVFQHEVFTDLAVAKTNLRQLIPARPKPFMFLDIADVRVEVFDIPMPQNYVNPKTYSSFKLSDFKFVDINSLKEENDSKDEFRIGVMEAFEGYRKYLSLKKRNLAFNPLQAKTSINYFLAERD